VVKSRRSMPEVNEFVVATIREIFDYGAYVELDEYNNMRAYLPWSEIASKWVRDIREVIRENQKVVVKVIRVNKAKGQVDVSLKRVYDSDRKKKILEFKRKQRAEKILELAAQRLKRTLDEAYEQVGWKLEDVYGEILAAFERAALEGEGALRDAGVPEEWIAPLMEVIEKHIEIKKVEVEGVFILRTTRPDGIRAIKRVLKAAKSAVNGNVEVRIYTIGAPRYRIEIVAENYKIAERALSKAVSEAEKVAKKENVSFQFQRAKKK